LRCRLAVAALLAASVPALGQEVRAVAVAVPETIRIGEPFTLGVAVRSSGDTAASFPNLLIIGQDLEQLAGAEIRRHRDSPREWRAYYRLTAWKVDSIALPPVTVDLHGPDGSRSITVVPPPLAIESVLPADTVPVWLDPPRPPVSLRNWLWLLLALLAAIIAWYLIRRWLAGRGSPEEEPIVSDPAATALAALNELVEAFERGEVQGAQFFDRLEGILREYLERTRSLAPGSSMRLLSGDAEVVREGVPPSEVLELSGLIRFARLHARGVPEVVAVGDCSAWIERDRVGTPSPDVTDAGAS
jgi:hypothetical protein